MMQTTLFQKGGTVFEKNVLYKSGDPKLLTIAKRQTWSAWRWRGTGPQFLRIGGRVFLPGRSLERMA